MILSRWLAARVILIALDHDIFKWPMLGDHDLFEAYQFQNSDEGADDFVLLQGRLLAVRRPRYRALRRKPELGAR